jgi:hypothetical protein
MVQLNNVRPGDLIRAEDWNALVAVVQGLPGPVSQGVVSPDFFGLTLGNAAAVLSLPSSQLTLGRVLDIFGEPINPRLADSINLLVLGQSPSMGVAVPAGTPINLVVSPTPGSPSSGGVLVTLGITDVSVGSYNAGTNTVILPKATVAPVFITLQATVPSGTDTYTTNDPSFGSVTWSGQVTQNKKFQGQASGLPIQVRMAITLMPPTGSTTMTLSYASDQHGNVTASVNPTIQISTT